MQRHHYTTNADDAPADEQPTPPVIVEILETIESVVTAPQ